MFIPFGLIVEYVCMIFAFRYLAGEKNVLWSSFKWFMLLTVVVETVGYVLLVSDIVNHGMYNIYLPLETFFKFYILYLLCRDYFKVSYIVVPFLLLFSAIWIYDSVITDFTKYGVRSNSVASLGILVICCAYFYFFLKKEEYVNIYEHPPFWIITGLFFFNLGGMAVFVFFDYLASIYLKQHIPIRFIIFTLLNFMLYGCWSYSFLCRYRNKALSS
jgi:hypothetical protein